MPLMDFPNTGSHFLSPTSHTGRGSYVDILHNIPQPTPPAVRSTGHVGYHTIGPASQPPTSAWVPPQQTILVINTLAGHSTIIFYMSLIP